MPYEFAAPWMATSWFVFWVEFGWLKKWTIIYIYIYKYNNIYIYIWMAIYIYIYVLLGSLGGILFF